MLDVVNGEASRTFSLPVACAAGQPAGSPEFVLLSRQTHALEFIATQLGQLASRAAAIELPIEMRPDYEMATRRLLQEAV